MIVTTFERPSKTNVLQYLRQLWFPMPITNLIGRNNKTEPCNPKNSTQWYCFKHVVLPFLSPATGWPTDTLFVLVEEDWRLRPTDNATMMRPTTAADMEKIRHAPGSAALSSAPSSSTTNPGTVGVVRDRVFPLATARPKSAAAAPTRGSGSGESLPPPAEQDAVEGVDDVGRTWKCEGGELSIASISTGKKPKQKQVTMPRELEDPCRAVHFLPAQAPP